MRLIPRFVTVAVAIAWGAFACIELHATESNASLPPALSGVNPRMLSGGLYSALSAQGAFGAPLTPARARADGVSDSSKGKPPAVLDARVGVNIRLGDDPTALPSTQRGQAEPHIARSVADPNLLLATFQEGRFAVDGGAVSCGYALSRNGGLSWTRSLTPHLTTASGGIFRRATDPVAGIGPQGELYLNALCSPDDGFRINNALVVSRSTDNGETWSAPFTVFQQTTALASPDKNWLAVNDFSATPNLGRLVVTWTNFTSNANGASTGNNLLAAVSDDRGATWTAPVAITPAGTSNQGTQPVFLPDGSLAVIYITFLNANNASLFSIQCKRSTDGGRTYPVAATSVVSFVTGYDDPDLRNGLFLPSATVARTTGEIFVTYVALVAGTPRVMVTKSADQGATWSTPVIASDNPAGSAVGNPAIAVTPDGQTVSTVFIDKRLTPTDTSGHNYFIDHYAAQSFDGGATWQPNIRLSEHTSDIRYATLTSQGYMLGDYLGLAPSLVTEPTFGVQPCVAIWCDTRTGDADPFAVRLRPVSTSDYEAWSSVNRIIQVPAVDDQDGDGITNFLEYADASDPRRADSGEDLFLRRPDATTLDVAWAQRAEVRSPFGDASLSIFPGPDLTKIPILGGNLRGEDLTADQLPPAPLRAGLVWRGVRTTVSVGAVYGIARSFRTTLGQTTPSQGEPIIVVGTDARLTNLSTRGPIRPAGAPMIAGFVLRGSARSILVRGVGPSLAAFGLPDFAADPSLLLFPINMPTARSQNDDWQSGGLAIVNFIAGTGATVGAFPFTSTKESALVFGELSAADYSAQVSNVATNGGTTGLIEIYDASRNSDGALVNLSTRGEVGPPDGALIAGFALRGTQPRRMLIRAIGPSLAQFNVSGALVDPVLKLYNSAGIIVATNDDWEISRSGAAIAATAQNVGAFALNPASLDAALLITLAPGNYTAVVTGTNGGTGLALVEIYDAN